MEGMEHGSKEGRQQGKGGWRRASISLWKALGEDRQDGRTADCTNNVADSTVMSPLKPDAAPLHPPQQRVEGTRRTSIRWRPLWLNFTLFSQLSHLGILPSTLPRPPRHPWHFCNYAVKTEDASIHLLSN